MSQEEDTAFILDNVVSQTVIPGQISQPEPPPGRTTNIPMQNPITHRTQSRIAQIPEIDPLWQEPDSPPPFEPFDQPDQNSPMPSPTPPPVPAPPIREPVTSTALQPADAIDRPLDFTDKNHVSIYNEMSKELPDPYDGSTDTLRDFLAQVQHRANNSNWTNMVTITTPGFPAVNLISCHGFVTMDQVWQHAATYWAQPSRNMQNSTTMYTAIYDSLEQPLLSKVKNQIDKCLAISSNSDSRDGPLLLKLVLTIVQVDTGSTIINLHEKLTGYHEKITNTNKFNVKALKKAVTTLMNDLEVRGEPMSNWEVFNMLLKAYKTITVENFSQWHKATHAAYCKNTRDALLTPAKLMCNADAECKTLLKSADWIVANIEFIAMQAKIAQHE